jgi:UDP-glucose 4-epimerase
VIPTVLGHDARLQFVHAEDALEVLRRAVVGDHHGVLNVAGDGVLLLSQAARRAGRPTFPVPGPSVSTLGGLARRIGAFHLSGEIVQYLTHGRGVDTTRLRQVFGYVPRRSTAEAFDDFLATRGHGPITADLVGAVTDRAYDAVRSMTRYVPSPRLAVPAGFRENADD